MKFLVIGGIDLSQNKETEIQLQYIEKCKELLAKSSTKRPTFHIQNEGCQMNSIQTESIAAIMEKMGYEMVDTEDADAVVFNTCTVRENANQKIYGHLGHLKSIKRNHPDMKIVLFGCMMQEHHVVEKIRKDYKYVNLVFGTHNIHKFPELFYRALQTDDQIIDIWKESDEIVEGMPTSRKYSFKTGVSVMFGCNNFCSYCIVPYVRGREKSRPMEDIVADAESLKADGVKEITLLGQNVNSYGRDLYGEPRFADLLRSIAATGIERIRFATSHPKDLNDDVIKAFGELDNLMPALHLPVQSGSNSILKAMHRRYTREHYLDTIKKLREVRPDIALSTDIIVGFPGETEEDFQQTYDLIKEVGYTQVFTFIYSKREGTPAARIEDDTPREVIQERFERLVNLVQDRALEVNQAEVGKVVPVLVEGASKRDETVLMGRSPKNLTVHAPIPKGVSIDDLQGTFVNVRVDVARAWYLRGQVIS